MTPSEQERKIFTRAVELSVRRMSPKERKGSLLSFPVRSSAIPLVEGLTRGDTNAIGTVEPSAQFLALNG